MAKTIKITEAIEFLQKVREVDGDLEIESMSGLWTRHDESTGEQKVVWCVGDGKSVEDIKRELKDRRG